MTTFMFLKNEISYFRISCFVSENLYIEGITMVLIFILYGQVNMIKSTFIA